MSMFRIYLKGDRTITDEAMRKRGIRGEHEKHPPHGFLQCQAYLVSGDLRTETLNWYNSAAGTKPGDMVTFTVVA